MKIKKTFPVKSHYSFESKIVNASVPLNNGNKDENNISSIDLNELFVPNSEKYFLVNVVGDSMIGANIFHGDILIVDSKAEAKDGSIVIAALNNETAVKTLRKIDGILYLYSENEKFVPIEIKPYIEFVIQGVVKHIIHEF